MGNSPTAHNGSDIFASITHEYEQLRQDHRGFVLLSKKDQSCYLLKEYTFCSEMLFRNKERELKEQISYGAREYIVSPVRIEAKVFNSFCSNSYKIYAIFEYPQVTLKEEIGARQKENKSFEEE
jgi:CRISPR/Cas system-associated endonuclease/helicase Cas3